MKNSRFFNVMKLIGTFIVVTIIAYGVLSFLNWNLSMNEWNGFSRFILAMIGIFFLFAFLEEL